MPTPVRKKQLLKPLQLEVFSFSGRASCAEPCPDGVTLVPSCGLLSRVSCLAPGPVSRTLEPVSDRRFECPPSAREQATYDAEVLVGAIFGDLPDDVAPDDLAPWDAAQDIPVRSGGEVASVSAAQGT